MLRRYLGEYVQGLSLEALRISVWKGLLANFSLTNMLGFVKLDHLFIFNIFFVRNIDYLLFASRRMMKKFTFTIWKIFRSLVIRNFSYSHEKNVFLNVQAHLYFKRNGIIVCFIKRDT